jgi:hypothetical protein
MWYAPRNLRAQVKPKIVEDSLWVCDVGRKDNGLYSLRGVGSKIKGHDFGAATVPQLRSVECRPSGVKCPQTFLGVN